MKSFLLVIDVQQGFLNENTLPVKRRIDELLKSKAFDIVIASVYQNYDVSPISQLMGWKKMTSPEEQMLAGEAKNADYVVYKSKYSAFNDSLIEILEAENNGRLPEKISVCGFDTQCCVLMTAADLFEAGIRPVVLTRYCASSCGKESHDAGIVSLESIIGESNLHHNPLI